MDLCDIKLRKKRLKFLVNEKKSIPLILENTKRNNRDEDIGASKKDQTS